MTQKTTRLGLTLLLSLGFAACSEPASESNSNSQDDSDQSSMDVGNNATSDMGEDDQSMTPEDLGSEDLDEADLGEEEYTDCVQVTAMGPGFLAYADDVSIEYENAVTPTVESIYDTVTVLFERYQPGPDIGTFELGEGADANFGTCAHCIFMRGDRRERAYYADRGTLVTREDPYSRRADMTVTNLRLVEVEVDDLRNSTPIPGGGCVEIAEFSIEGSFPAPGWTCEAERYQDGMNCDCECGTVDPDCNDRTQCPINNPDCQPQENLPIANCEDSQLCLFEPISMGTVCADTCDWLGRSGCDEGVCLYDFGLDKGDTCIDDDRRLVPEVAVGSECPTGSGLQLFCAVENGFSMGYCGPNNVCRSICQDDSECTETDHTCRFFLGSDGLGYCGPEPTDPDG